MNSNQNRSADSPEIAKRRNATLALRHIVQSHIGHFSLTRGVERLLRKGRFYVPHSPDQASLITDLHDLQNEVWDFRIRRWAEYLETNPEDYQQYGKRSVKQRVRAFMHANRLIILGLLSKAQSEYYGSVWYGRGTLDRFSGEKTVREFLDFTEEQIETFKHIEKAYRDELGCLPRMTMDPDVSRQRKTITKQYRANRRRIYTEKQIAIWEQLIAKRAAPAPPNWRLLAETRRQPVKLKDCSRIFGLIEDQLHLSTKQQQLLGRFKPIVQQGIDWINEHRVEGLFPAGDQRNNVKDPAEQVRTRYLKHAEGFATFGFLTQPQIAIVDPEIWASLLDDA